MEKEIKQILYEWLLGSLEINLNRTFDFQERNYKQEELYKKLLEKLEIKLK